MADESEPLAEFVRSREIAQAGQQLIQANVL
jgi:hypothetical protein